MGNLCSGSKSNSIDDGYRPLASRVDTSLKTGQLDASGLGISTLSELRPGLHDRVRTLNCSRNKLTELKGFDQYPLLKLQRLVVSENKGLTSLPSLHENTALVLLEAKGCNLSDESIAPLPSNVKEVDLSENARLSRVPRSLYVCVNLRVLRLNGVGLTQLPAEIVALTGLCELWIDDNPLESLALVDGTGSLSTSASWAQLPRLVSLSARRCRLRADTYSIPQQLLQDSNVSTLHFAGNAGLTQRGLLALPGMDAYVQRRKKVFDKGWTSDGGGRMSLNAHLCGVEG